MKNAIFTGSRKNKLASTGMISVILISVLFLAGCFYFEFVNQPYHADPNSFFEVQISVIVEGDPEQSDIAYFGILLPSGWLPADSIEYIGINYGYTGMLIHSDSLSQAMETRDPAPDNYYWWVASGYFYGAQDWDTYHILVNIFTDSQTGTFFLDYMLGSEWEGLNYRRSNEHLIIVGGVVLSNQSDIDNFPINFPNCGEFAGDIIISGDDITNFDGLNALTSISGSLWIINNTSLTSLTGMVNLTSIGGTFSITGNSSLTYIQGLNSLTSVGRHLLIEDNTDLVNISGLNALTDIGIDMSLRNNSLISFTGMNNLLSIGRNLIIDDNDELHSIIGMSNLTSIGGYLTISNNASLNNITGLNNLTSIGGYFDIYNNTSLTSLFGLENMISIGGYLSVSGNAALNSLTGLEGLTSIGGSLYIYSNPLLCNCEVDAICAYLTDPNGTISILGNASGCSSLIDVAVSCGTTLPCLEEGTYYLFSQFDVDHFPAVFPGCTEILCDIYINGDDITNLNSLAAITSIGGNLRIYENAALDNLSGLEGLTSVGNLSIYSNAALTSLAGLEGLTSVGSLSISSNDSLISLAGFEGLTSISGSLSIQENAALVNLTGLENLTSIGGDLRIQENAALVNLAGLEGLTSIGGSLIIGYYYPYSANPSLNSLMGLEGLTSIGGDLRIQENVALVSLAGLESLTSIGGTLRISSNDGLTSLAGFEGLTSVGGLSIFNNDALSSLAGLEGLTSIEGPLYIYSNYALSSLVGLENLTSIGGYLLIKYNDALSSLTGLDNVITIGDYFEIYYNRALSNLTGIERLTSIGGYFKIDNNDALVSLAALESLNSIGDYLRIQENAALVSLAGLENLTSIAGGLTIIYNPLLCNCEIDAICAYLADPNGVIQISNNAVGCSLIEVAANCGTTLPCLEQGTYPLTSQFAVDHFPAVFPGCSDIVCSVSISGGDIVNLDSLGVITSIQGNLYVSNTSLVSLAGLESLTSIGGSLYIYSNPVLCNCEVDAICTYLSDSNGYISVYNNGDGCSSLMELAASCGTTLPCLEQGTYELTSQFVIDHFPAVFPGCNDIVCSVSISGGDITNLDSLSVISSIQGNLTVSNTSLTSLAGLEGLTSIGGGLTIRYNPQLCHCEVDAICACLSDPNGNISVYNNGDGCSSLMELAASCGTTMPCLEQGTYELTSQFVIDHFPAVFPGCNDIVCSVSISGDDITNLDSLSVISSIQGNLTVSNTSLVSLTGLEGLTSIGGNLSISYNDALVSLAGLEGLTSIGGSLYIYSNPVLCNCEVDAICTYLSDPNGYSSIHDNDDGCSGVIELAAHCGTTLPCLEEGTYELTSQFEIDHFPAVFPGCSAIACNVSISGDDITNLDSLNVISSIQGNLFVSYTSLVSLAGLEELTSIGGYLSIYNNDALNNMTGMEGLTSIGGNLSISYNDALVSLAGLEGLNVIGGSLSINNNPLLCNCEVDAICTYFSDPNGSISIYNNDNGCSSVIELAVSCGTTLPCLEEGTYELTSQFEVDHFPVVFPDCSEIVCNVSVRGDDITNLDSLYVITSIGGNLTVNYNDALTGLNGLENLTSIGGYLNISNNTALNSMSGLEGLTTIGGYLRFSHNTELTSLSGLGEGIFIGGGLTIYSNLLLSQCEVEAVCAYLTNPSGVILISNNAPGCDSEEEVEAACLVGVEESAVSGRRSAVRVFPNPTYEIVHIEYEIENPSPVSIQVFNAVGEKVAVLSDGILAKGQHKITWNAAELPAGIYFYQLRAKGVEQVVAGKIMKR